MQPRLKNKLIRRLTAALAVSALLPLAAPVLAEVNVYSYRQPYLIEPMFEAFTEQTGIKVNTVFAKKGLIERLVNEGDNSPADLLITTDIGRILQGVKAGVTQSVESDKLNNTIPAEFRAEDKQWFGISARARLIVVAKDRVGEDEIASYADLASPALKGRICTRSGKHDYMVALIASQLAHNGEEAATDWLSKLKTNLARKPQGNDRAQIKAIAQGECDVAVVNSYYMGVMLSDPEQAAAAETVRVVFPDQGGNGTHMNVSGMSMTKSAPNKMDAVMLMEFLVSKEAQALYADVNHEYPVRPDMKASDLVASWGDFNYDSLSMTDIAAQRALASKLVDRVGYDN
ncbi:MAG: Fe(3+) ABC transporter substrate-binding protein [Granulosicoccaceae bacterium]